LDDQFQRELGAQIQKEQEALYDAGSIILNDHLNKVQSAETVDKSIEENLQIMRYLFSKNSVFRVPWESVPCVQVEESLASTQDMVWQDSFLMSLGFTKNKADSNLYYKVEDDGLVILLLYVDDLFLTGNEKLIVECKRELSAEFEMKDMGPLHYFFDLEVWQGPDGIFYLVKENTLLRS